MSKLKKPPFPNRNWDNQFCGFRSKNSAHVLTMTNSLNATKLGAGESDSMYLIFVQISKNVCVFNSFDVSLHQYIGSVGFMSLSS